MRDSHILAGLGQIENKVGHDVQLLAEQVRLVRFRQEAIETVLFGSRFRMAWIAVLSIFKPSAVQDMLDIETEAADLAYKEAIKQEVIARAKKAKGIVLPKGVGVIGA